MSDKEKIKKLGEQCGTMAGMLLFVINGLRKGSITSKPILLMDENATEYPMVTLESEIWKALGKCGITEKKRDQATEGRKKVSA